MRWSYGITTVIARRQTYLPRTLESLKAAGFDRPRLFVDSCDAAKYADLGLPITERCPQLGIVGNWLMTAWELYLRDKHADLYAVFQDDFVTYRNLRQYLEKCQRPMNGYMNLLTFMENDTVIRRQPAGWYPAKPLKRGEIWQGGRGAVALVFGREVFLALL